MTTARHDLTRTLAAASASWRELAEDGHLLSATAHAQGAVLREFARPTESQMARAARLCALSCHMFDAAAERYPSRRLGRVVAEATDNELYRLRELARVGARWATYWYDRLAVDFPSGPWRSSVEVRRLRARSGKVFDGVYMRELPRKDMNAGTPPEPSRRGNLTTGQTLTECSVAVEGPDKRVIVSGGGRGWQGESR